MRLFPSPCGQTSANTKGEADATDFEKDGIREDAGGEETGREDIIDFGSVTARNRKYAIQCLTVVGQIEGHQLLPPNIKTTKYEHMLPLLASIEESEDIDGLLIMLNTVGGDIEAGLAIAELISGMKKPAVSLVLGGGHSIGVPLAVAAKLSMIAPTAGMTIHPVRLNGVVLGIPQTFFYFERIQERIVKFVAQNSRCPEEHFRELMLRTGELAGDVGSMIYGSQAVECGLIDRVGSLSDALGALHEMVDEGRKQLTIDN
ncbi:MAG: ATP-dependent Clp protease proteolytic subunit [Oscillospiraceae bacterium]|jgi:ATP-dependent protease ClpP protease subunit|nr:ATP-dependent Clp protease proteolytic subunit [Oscillospiraceae bacterium]